MLKSSRIRKHRSKRYRSRIERTVHVSIRSSTISQKTRSTSNKTNNSALRSEIITPYQVAIDTLANPTDYTKTRFLNNKKKRKSWKYQRCLSIFILTAYIIFTILTILLITLLTKSNSRNAASSTTTDIPCPLPSYANATTSTADTAVFYSFDSTLADSSANAVGNATSSQTVSYASGWVGNAVSLTYANSQRIIGASIDFSSQSFTIEMWLYWTTYGSLENGLFGACTQSIGSRCMFIQIRPYNKIYFGFFFDDTIGITTLPLNTWFHIACVYDYTLQQRSVYLNGILDGVGTTNKRLMVKSANVSLGSALTGGYTYYGGRLDHLTVSLRAKSACEILQDATLSAYFSFDSAVSALTDSGPNFLKATGNAFTISSGHRKSAVFFTSVGSYLQIAGVRILGQTAASVFALPFSISLWLCPLVCNGSVLHVSSNNIGLGWCDDFLSFTTTGHIVAEIVVAGAIGPILPTNVWTHVVMTYSPTNNLRLFINGSLYTTTVYMAYPPSNAPMYVTLANPLNGTGCGSYSTRRQYLGGIDELRIFSRELNTTDISTLANE